MANCSADIERENPVTSHWVGGISQLYKAFEIVPVVGIVPFFETGSRYVAWAGLEFNNLPASASQMLGLQVYTTAPGLSTHFLAGN
jgi:hypothetical protein